MVEFKDDINLAGPYMAAWKLNLVFWGIHKLEENISLEKLEDAYWEVLYLNS